MAKKKTLKIGVIGYGPAFNMGKYHLTQLQQTGRAAPVAVCDLDEKRLAVAREEFPGVETFTDVGAMLKKSDADLIVNILPHHLHAPVAVQCLNAGRHVVVEKPFALSVAECDRMIAAARKNKVVVSCFHNRHWDSNILTIVKHLDKIGRPYRWESHHGGWKKPKTWWRSRKEISGGTIFDWGAHFTEWLLQVMQYKMTEVAGYLLDEVWKHVTNEDEVEAVVRFGRDGIATHTQTAVAVVGKPAIRICGTKGAILADHGSVTVHTVKANGARVATSVPMEPGRQELYYANVVAHLLDGKPLVITAEWARRVIQVLDYATQSAQRGRALKPKYA